MLTILQLLISVVVIYVIFSAFVYLIVEWLSGFLQLRGRLLRRAIIALFDDLKNPGTGKAVYDHPQVSNLNVLEGKLPAYVAAGNISAALLEVVSSTESSGSTAKNLYQNYINAIAKMPDGRLKKLLTTLSQQSKDATELSAAIEKWFNDSMDRVSGLYKRKIKLVTFIVSIIVTGLFNVNTIHIIEVAKADPVVRQHLNDLADQVIADSTFVKEVRLQELSDADYHKGYVNDSSLTETEIDVHEEEYQSGPLHKKDSIDQANRSKRLKDISELIANSDLPIGWMPGEWQKLTWWSLVGLAITAFALTAGAPYWFDVLKKLVNARSAGPKPVEITSTTKKNEP